MNRYSKLPLLIFIALVPVIIYLYFFEWKTGTVYGDDLYMFKNYYSLTGFWDKINMPVSFGKFRPVHGVVTHLLITWFKNDVHGYYVFNVGIQALNTFAFALIINLFLRSPLLSLFVGLVVGLSRFGYFNISQLLNGGALEGLAMSFFLLSTYFLIKCLVKTDTSRKRKTIWLMLSIMFANFSMYTHERYIVILAFIVIVVLFSPAIPQLGLKRKILLASLAVLSILLNVLLKKYVYAMPFFVGTGGTNISFSFSSALNYLSEAILSVLQINTGPEYLAGIHFSSLDFLTKMAVIVLLLAITAIIIIYLGKCIKSFAINWKKDYIYFSTFIFLLILFGFLLVPAIVTIRLEQRWLQATAAVFILIVVLSFSGAGFKRPMFRSVVLPVIIMLFIVTDFVYLKKGVGNIYLSYSEKTATDFKNAILSGKIPAATSTIYLLEKQRDENSENGISWELGGGYIFDFYQKKEKRIVFIDSTYKAVIAKQDSIFSEKRDTIQVIDLATRELNDVTSLFLPAQSQYGERMNLVALPVFSAKTANLFIGHTDIEKYKFSGFYKNEGGFRWTNGNASIGFQSDFLAGDSLTVLLNSFMPPVCKNVKPEISLADSAGNLYKSQLIKREGDKFIFRFHFSGSVTVSSLTIISQTIPAVPPDTRVLSFPFVSIELSR